MKNNIPSLPTSQEFKESAHGVHHFFKLEDWGAALITTLISGLAFYYYMAPEVTLQDSGELVTGAFTFGVPHPPGYPLWAFLGYLWSHFFVPFGNPAWRMGLLSVFTGALTVGLMTIIMTRSLRLLLHSLPWGDKVDERLQHWIALFTGTACALFFGFNRGVWLWACVSEMRVLNVFSFILTSCVFFAWMVQPNRRGFLYAMLLIFGLSLSNHQTIAVMGAPFAVGIFLIGLDQFFETLRNTPKASNRLGLFMRAQSNFAELTIAGLLSLMIGLIIWAWLTTSTATEMLNNTTFWKGLAAGVAGIMGMITAARKKWWEWRRALIATGMFVAGVSVYIYMPLAAWTNPPMNWGYAATKEGFVHAVTRAQYEKINAASFFSHEFFLKIKLFIEAMINQYSLPLTLLGLVTPIVIGYYWFQCKPRGRSWMVFVWTAFLITSLGLLTIINPKLDRQDQEINIKFFAPAHGFYAMLIGYGIAVLFSIMAWKHRGIGGWFVRLACIALLAIPLVTYNQNLALCNLRGHDFGYLFGYLMFKPGNGYPEMEKDAILYGGTDPGRFVPTYMIFCESRVRPQDRFRDKNFDRSDVYIITQNALADNTYMNYIRDHYDYSRPKNDGPLQKLLHRDHTYPVQPIYIPSSNDNNRAFQEFVNDVQSGKIPAGGDIKIENGRVSVQGVGAVMNINGTLARWIFEKNKDKHAFYVEESYVIPWMYGFMTPFGVIMKIEKQPVPSPQENPKYWEDIVTRDRQYWDKLSHELLAREEFVRNSDAKKSFSKMRSAIAGLYAARGLIAEAEYAFTQSRTLCPESPEACFRLSELLMRQQRYDDAAKVMAEYLVLDPYNRNAASFLDTIRRTNQENIHRKELETELGKGKLAFGQALELAGLYLKFGMEAQFQGLTHSLIDTPSLPSEAYAALSQFFETNKRWDMNAYALQKYLALNPTAFKSWIDLAYTQLILNQAQEGLASLNRAVTVGGEVARGLLREDPRFAPLRDVPSFKALVPPSKKSIEGKLPSF